MVLWNELDKNLIVTEPLLRDRTRFSYDGSPLRFQIPRGMTTWGVSEYRTLNVDITHPEFAAWWVHLETLLCPAEPFKTNLVNGSLRLKIDDASYIFDQNSKQINPEIREGLFRGREVQCIVEIDSTYFFKGVWGLTIRIYQLKTSTEPEELDVSPLEKGVCAFLGT